MSDNWPPPPGQQPPPPPPPPPPPGGGYGGGYQQPQYGAPPGGGYQQPGYGGYGGGGTRPPNYLALSIILMIVGLCFCFPFFSGIVATVFSSQVNGKWNRGDYAGAAQASKNAKTWLIVTGALFGVSILINILAFATGNANYYADFG